MPQSRPSSELLRHAPPRSEPSQEFGSICPSDEPQKAAPVGFILLAGLALRGEGLGPSPGDTTCPGNQGIKGVVRMVSGNQMPAPGVKRGPLPSVKARVYVFELTNISQVVQKGSSPYYSAVHTRLVTVVDTDSTGHFCVCLPEGRYSLFTRRGEWYFASRRDVDNNLAPAEVSKGKMTQVECHIEGSRPPVY